MTLITEYYYLGRRRVAMSQDGTVSYLLADHPGSTSLTTDASGGTVQRQSYYPYGSLRQGSGLPTDYGFTGQRLDSYIKLIQMGSRWYDPDLGRFTQPDPIVPQLGNPQALNRYTYALNNPLKYRDPSGHDWQDIVNGAGDFFTGATDEAWYNVAWFVPQHEELKVQDGESLAKTAGRVFGDTIALGIAVAEVVGGDAMMGGGAAGGVLTCVETLGGGCVVGAAVVAGGVVVEGSGVVTGGSAILNGGKNLDSLITMAQAKGPFEEKIAGTEGLQHSFDRHASQWFGRPVSSSRDLAPWQSLVERAAQSKETFSWSVGGSSTFAHLARIDGKWFVVQFYTDGPHAGELATAFVPNQDELNAMLRALGK